jgi:hypothetical protein
LVESSAVDNDAVELTEEQILMLHLSDQDIETGKLISQDQLDKNDLEWLKRFTQKQGFQQWDILVSCIN